MEFVAIVILIGLLPAVIAQGKGRSFIAWWIYGSLLFIVALPHSLMLKNDVDAIEQRQLAEGNAKCPFCAEIIKGEAKVCRFCGRDLPTENVARELEGDHAYYASMASSASMIYRDDDPAWRRISSRDLLTFSSLSEAMAKLPGYGLHHHL